MTSNAALTRPSIKRGISLDRAAEGLRSVVMEGERVANGAAGRGLTELRNDYLIWLRQATAALQNAFAESDLWLALHSEYFWKIRDLTDEQPRASELITDEASRQADRIEALRRRLEDARRFVDSHPGRLAVLDTHVLLHFEPMDQIDWVTVLGNSAIHLVLPLRVVEEIDEKKYTGNAIVRPRARSVVRYLRKTLAPGDGGPIEIRPGVTVEVLLDNEPRRRSADADQEILDSADALAGTDVDVQLVTDDAGMELRAGALGIPVVRMPEKYLRVRDQEA